MASRNPGLDAARAVAMAMVVTTHAAISFMVTPIGWAIQDRSQTLVADGYAWLVRSCVMPIFFWLSGYFARAIYEHGGAHGFVRHRVVRIAVPLAVGLVPCSFAADALWDWGREVGGRAEVAANVPKLEGSGMLITLGHLWYLYYLLAMSAGALAVVAIARRVRFAPGPDAMVAVVTCIVVGLLLHGGALQLDTPLGFAIDQWVTLFYGVFFAWGWVIHAHPEELERYAAGAWGFVATAVLLIAVVAPTLLASTDPANTEALPAYAIVASGASNVALVAAVLGLCLRYARRDHRVVRLTSEASYWTYVAHFPLVVMLQIVLADVALPGALKFVAMVAAAAVACLTTYELMIRRTALRRVLG
jgi:glucans biosynthesis protein C